MSSVTQNLKTVPIFTTILIAINVLVFLAEMFMPGAASIYNMGVLSTSSLAAGRWWTLITSMFMHGGIAHIICNMCSLYFLGAMMERVLGSGKFVLLYFISGICGGIAYVGVNYALGDPSGAVGASGAIFGLFGAYGYFLFRERRQPVLLVQSPGKAEIQSYLSLLAVNLAFGLLTPGIANMAHVGGLVSGFIVGAILYSLRVRPLREQRYGNR